VLGFKATGILRGAVDHLIAGVRHTRRLLGFIWAVGLCRNLEQRLLVSLELGGVRLQLPCRLRGLMRLFGCQIGARI
jgi:hypothetical protein